MNCSRTLIGGRSFLIGMTLLGSIVAAGAQELNLANPNEKNVVYGEAGGEKQYADIYLPEDTKKARPAVVIIHGGGWSAGNKMGVLQRRIATELQKDGFVCFAISYRLVKPEGNKYPAQIDDVQRAVRWIRSNAEKFGVDPKRIGAIGDSAGGHLVALLGLRETRDNSDATLAKYSSRVNAVVDIYGPTDFTIPPSQLTSADSMRLSIVRNFIGKSPQEAPELYKDASPIVHVDKKATPFLIVHGDKDVLVPLDQSQKLHDLLKKNGTEVAMTVFEGEGHGFRKPETYETFFKKVKAFFGKHLK